MAAAPAAAANRLRCVDLSVSVEADFWFELENKKLVEWKLDEPTVTLRAPMLHPSRRAVQKAHHAANILTLSRSSFAADTILSGALEINVRLLNFNTIQQLTDLDKTAFAAHHKARIASAVSSGAWLATDSLAQAAMFTFADLKIHRFNYAVVFPVLDLGTTPARIDAKEAASGVLSEDQFTAVAAFAASHTSTFIPFAVSASTKTAAPLTAASLSSPDTLVAMWDPSASPDFPGWPWRNVVAALRLSAPAASTFRLLLLRESAAASLLVTIGVDALPAGYDVAATGKIVATWPTTPLYVDMQSMMDPARLAASSARLNLGLVKWRMLPEIELEELAACKALLLGSGTLGCNIARHLLMWGVTHITLVDRGSVSFSNPVRQTLFELADCLKEGEARVKSVAAAAAIKRILPTANATGVSLTIRMPGHRVDAEGEPAARQDVEKLESLIREHDVVFLLTDSRESRWLPTLLCAAHDKPVINTALGFDSYVVMRHGVTAQGAKRVGCYFCNDVVAPMDSLTARTLDQQCTVTRPGLSAIASALSVEMVAAIYNHPKRFGVAAHVEESEDPEHNTQSTLGIIPHQVRGSVSNYGQFMLHGVQYDQCTACSDAVVNAYKREGFPFILRCLNDPSHMEAVSGLKAMKEQMAEKYSNWEDDEF